MDCPNCTAELEPRVFGLGFKQCEACRARRRAASARRRERRREERGFIVGYAAAAGILKIPESDVASLEDRLILHRHNSIAGEPVFARADLALLNAAGYGNPIFRRPGATLDHVCPVCGGEFVGREKTIFCGVACKQRQINVNHYAKRKKSRS